MIGSTSERVADLPPDMPPQLLVIIDTEEEFDWGRPVARKNTGVQTIQVQHRAQEIFGRFGVVPTYVVDYPVAATESSSRVLKAFLDAGECEIGAHLHPWVNPPFDEEVNARNSYPGNLPAALEREKLERLTAAIESAFGIRPVVYKAGRYGVGPATASILEALGYEIDVSVVPRTWYTDDGGPDFRTYDSRLFWFGSDRDLLEVPLSCGFAGALAANGPAAYPVLAGPMGMRFHVPGIFARLGLIERITLTPEGIDHAAHRRLTRSLLAQGCKVFCFTYHSPSSEPGHTPYVRDRDDLAAFLSTMDAYFRYFIEDVGGEPSTPTALRERLAAS